MKIYMTTKINKFPPTTKDIRIIDVGLEDILCIENPKNNKAPRQNNILAEMNNEAKPIVTPKLKHLHNVCLEEVTKNRNGDEKHTPTTIIRNEIRKQFDVLIEPLDDGDHVFTTWGKKLYNVCLNDSEHDSSLQTLKIFKEVNGWLVLEGDDWNENKFNLEDTMGRFRRNGLYFSSLLELYFTNDHLEPSKAILTVSFPYRSRLQKNEDQIIKLMVDVAVLFDANETLASYEILKVVEFGAKLREVCKLSNL
ncbi:hypothetical protein FQA39_LY09380 [Lamprigera yunnana]|nr:hypothetical protein FQA39_LY09380 [Lamprigera yunnana]